MVMEDYIHEAETFKCLGVILDYKLSWDAQVNSTCNKISKNKYLLNLVKNTLLAFIKKIIYFAHIHSHLMYVLVLWGPMLTEKQMKRIFKQQKSCVRIIVNVAYNAHTDPIFKQLKILN